MATDPLHQTTVPKQGKRCGSYDLCQCPTAYEDDCMVGEYECMKRMQRRHCGFAADASDYPRDEVGLRLLSAFVGVDWRSAPPGWWFHPNKASKAAWERVADEARAIFAAEKV